MKKWNCDGCRIEIEVPDDYEPKGCCDGRFCGCKGLQINPVFCDDCFSKIFGKEQLEKLKKDLNIND